MSNQNFTADRARELFNYNPSTGELTWRDTGLPAGKSSPTHPYLVVYCDREKRYVHRVIWLWMTGEQPVIVDHLNGDSLCNRWGNLRNVTQAVNMQNRHRANKKKHGHPLGVKQRSPTTWQANLRLSGKNIYLGTYASPEAAHAAYVDGKRRLHAGCTI